MHIDQAINVEFLSINTEGISTSGGISGNFKQNIDTRDKNKTYLVYSKDGLISTAAAGIMEELGFTKLYSLQGGIRQWEAEGLPVIKY